MADGSLRILILAPFGRDGKLMASVLGEVGIEAVECPDILHLRDSLLEGCGAVLVTEEALDRKGMASLRTVLDEQPPWSDVPIMVLTEAPSFESKVRSFRELGTHANLTLVDRPVRIKTLTSAVESALRSRQRQYEIRALMAQLEERVRERDRFLAILGHELRNPLGAILLAAQMADPRTGTLDAEHAALIERQANHLTRLVDDLLNLSRITAGKIVLQKGIVDLRAVAQNAMDALEKMSPGRVACHLPDREVTVEADPARMEQVLINLLTNAVKYTPDHGQIDLFIEQDGPVAIVRVKDTGVGIPPSQLEAVFDMFTQAKNVDPTKGGMGIGLALVRNLVELHGGEVFACSDGVGKGSEFIVRLPVRERPGAAVPIAPPALARTADVSFRIVIVEDNQDVRALLQAKLKRLGHEVTSAANGAEGLEMILATNPDLAIVDIAMPGMDGYEVARRVREHSAAIYLAALSGFGQPDDRRRSIEAGFDEHLTKPIDVKQIQELIERVAGAGEDAAAAEC